MRSLYDLEVDQWAELLDDEPTYRREQIWDGIHAQHRDIEDLTSLPKALRERLAAETPRGLELVTESVSDGGDTIKFLWELRDGSRIETVLMHYRERSTVCVSSQAGCAMACSFCATGQAGFTRHLSTGEIVEQVVRAQQRADLDSTSGQPRRVSNIVYMGMGEPLANFDSTLAAAHRIRDHLGIGARHQTISTVGIIPGIKRLAAEPLQVGLAVSLHAANNDLRNSLAPINKRYPLEDLMDACAEYIDATHRRLSFEWAMIEGVNDSQRDADELAHLARPLGAHVNLIPLNRTPGYPTSGSPASVIKDFVRRLEDQGVNVTVRDTRGSDIDAACGQLKTASVEMPTRRRVRD
ncbi:MAG: 23S rRNA (adenine(2503)-C(2))-methyltransferase RlmN [Microthrixaceae bacterium]|nr:23S rRNA (adenine(2503)-C(2))-methyltransferase RlmN [Microthrixaceae bacterium]